METVVIIIMLAVALTFVLKLSCHSLAGCLVTSAVAALFTALCGDFASMQSKTQIADWLGDSSLMLDTSVLLTADVMLQSAFCFLRTRKAAGEKFPPLLEAVYLFCFRFPGILIFPVLLSVLVQLVFAFPGRDFHTTTWLTGAAVLVAAPLCAYALRLLLPRLGMRLELLFLVCLLTAALGVVATVNGRTAAAGTSAAEWSSLAAVLGLLAAGALTGFIIYRIKNSRHKNILS